MWRYRGSKKTRKEKVLSLRRRVNPVPLLPDRIREEEGRAIFFCLYLSPRPQTRGTSGVAQNPICACLSLDIVKLLNAWPIISAFHDPKNRRRDRSLSRPMKDFRPPIRFGMTLGFGPVIITPASCLLGEQFTNDPREFSELFLYSQRVPFFFRLFQRQAAAGKGLGSLRFFMIPSLKFDRRGRRRAFYIPLRLISGGGLLIKGDQSGGKPLTL